MLLYTDQKMTLNRKPARTTDPADDGLADGFNNAEQRAVDALRKLARQWPRTLMLFSNAGELTALRIADLDAFSAGGGELPRELPSEVIQSITNDGGPLR